MERDVNPESAARAVLIEKREDTVSAAVSVRSTDYICQTLISWLTPLDRD